MVQQHPPEDLHRLIKLSSSWRKVLLVVAIPAFIIGAVFLVQGRPVPCLVSLAIAALFGFLALKPKDPRKSKAIRLLAERPLEVSRVSVVAMSGLGGRTALLHLFTDKKRAEASLLVDDVPNLNDVLSTVARHATRAQIEREDWQFE